MQDQSDKPLNHLKLMSTPLTQIKIVDVCDAVKRLLLEKNRSYGDSALNPVRIFSKANTTEQLLVRIDDKLSRISRGVGMISDDEDVITDLIGYLVLLKISIEQDKNSTWDGSDIDAFNSHRQQASTDWEYMISNSKNSNDKEWSEIYAAGDRFG